jgi:hypothetical protein
MGCSFYFARNDGIGGHVWLSDGDLRALADEMVVQGMQWPGRFPPRTADEIVVPADELDAMLESAAPEPAVLPDAKLWLDWLRFLEGAVANGGVLVRG